MARGSPCLAVRPRADSRSSVIAAIQGILQRPAQPLVHLFALGNRCSRRGGGSGFTFSVWSCAVHL
jgi:hypothetical protein